MTKYIFNFNGEIYTSDRLFNDAKVEELLAKAKEEGTLDKVTVTHISVEEQQKMGHSWITIGY